MSEEPVKVKMQLHAARPSIQCAATPTSAASAAVAAVEARWRAEDKKERAERFRRRASGCLAWLFILVVVGGGAWYFTGDKFLPSDYTFQSVLARVKDLLGYEPVKKDESVKKDGSVKKEDPADVKTAAERTRIKNFVSQLERLCASDLKDKKEPIVVDVEAWSVGKAMLNEIVSADSWYFKARQKLAEVEEHNTQLGKLRKEEPSAKKRQYASQYKEEMLYRQKNMIDKKLDDCKRVRAQVAQRAIKAVKAAASQWTGPVSRKDAAQFVSRLETLSKKF